MEQLFNDLNVTNIAMEEIEYNLLLMTETGVSNNVLTDSKGLPVHIDGKSVNYPKIEMLVPDRYSINYEPLVNRKLAHYMFTKYATMRQQEGGINIIGFFISRNLKHPDLFFATCRTDKGDINSYPFTNESVCWCNLIYNMEYGGSDYNAFNNIDMKINLDRMIQQQEREEAKKKNGKNTK